MPATSTAAGGIRHLRREPYEPGWRMVRVRASGTLRYLILAMSIRASFCDGMSWAFPGIWLVCGTYGRISRRKPVTEFIPTSAHTQASCTKSSSHCPSGTLSGRTTTRYRSSRQSFIDPDARFSNSCVLFVPQGREQNRPGNVLFK